MQYSCNGPKCAKNYEDDNLELIFLNVQLEKDLLTIKNDFYKFWPHSLQIMNKNKNDAFVLHFFVFYILHENLSLTSKIFLYQTHFKE